MESSFVSRRLGLFLLAAGALGLGLRLAELARPLWLDEFGTLWVVEGDLRTVFARTDEFQGQSPFFYLACWVAVQSVGESELALRLPAFLCGVASLVVLASAGGQLGRGGAGPLAALLAWLHPVAIDMDRIARPYSLAFLATAVLHWGFLRATRGGRVAGRLAFVAGGVGLFYAHYLLSLQLLGLLVAYAWLRDLRANYRPRLLALDLALMALLILPGVSHLVSLHARREALSYLAGFDYLVPLQLGLVLLPLAGLSLLASRQLQSGATASAIRLLWVVVLVHVALVYVLAAAGVNILAPRYMSNLLVPLCLLGGCGLAWLVSQGARLERARLLVGVVWLLLPAVALVARHTGTGIWGFWPQEWSVAVARLEHDLARDPDVPVLYRSGFIEDNLRVGTGRVSTATLAPLRSPGLPRPDWNLIPLTRDWDLRGRAAYFERSVVPAIALAPRFYYVSDDRNPYGTQLSGWLEHRFPGLSRERLPGGEGIVLLRFTAPGASGS